MALGKLRPAGNQDEGHDTPEQAGAINQNSSPRTLIREAEACKQSQGISIEAAAKQ